MRGPGLKAVALWLLIMAASGAHAAEAPLSAAHADLVYKGVIGKALDAVDMNPDERAALQRMNAVVSGTLAGRSLSVWAGMTNPLLLIGGLVWGLFAAANIQPDHPPSPPLGGARAQSAGSAARSHAYVRSPDQMPVESAPDPVNVSELSR